MTKKRVLLLGVTGTEKRAVMDRLTQWCQKNYSRKIAWIDFEHQYLAAQAKQGDFSQILQDRESPQFDAWRKAWCRIDWEDVGNGAEALMLGMHGTFVRQDYGVRVVYDPTLIKDFAPNLVVTLVDDVYDMWWRTEARAHGEPWRGMPTLEQLLTARRVEQVVGLQAAHLNDPPVPHYVLSTKHPCETLARLILENPVVVYLSFPITEPRRMHAEDGNSRGIAELNDYLKKVYTFQAQTRGVVFINPLAIDELPLKTAWEVEENRTYTPEDQRSRGRLRFDREALRWRMDEFCKPGELLTEGPPPAEQRKALSLEQVANALGLVETDVGWRDYALVRQADHLAVWNPVFNGLPSTGAQKEMDTAAADTTPQYIYQDPQHLPPDQDESGPGGPQHPMVPTAPSNLRVECSSVTDLLERVSKR